MNEREMMELRLAAAVVVVLIVAFIAVYAVWSRSAPAESFDHSSAAPSDAAAATRAMTFTQPKASSK
jgi:hypothetical protein